MTPVPDAKTPAPAVADAGEEFAPAKINLALHVVGKRADGYHRLESLVVFATDLGDTIVATDAAAQSLVFDGPFADALRSADPSDNLVIRAADVVAKRRPLRWTVTKRIPIAAGLGGGSADAAATLRLLDRMWGLKLGRQRLAAMAASLGADVAMCLLSRPLIARGVGEQVTPVAAMPALPLVLACPPVAVKTVDVFRALADPHQPPLPALPTFAGADAVADWLRRTRNDLAAPASRVSAAAGAAAAALARDRDCLFARMTGSGPAAFALFPSRAAAEAAAARLKAAEPSWWVRAAITGPSLESGSSAR